MYVIGFVPLHVPLLVLSVQPTAVEPVIAGAVELAGGVAPATTAVVAEFAGALPDELCAVTVTRSLCPASAMTSVYVCEVAPEMFAQFAPALSQRCHTYVKVIGVVPLQLPLDAASVFPCAAVPEMVGTLVFDGGVPAAVVAPPTAVDGGGDTQHSAPDDEHAD